MNTNGHKFILKSALLPCLCFFVSICLLKKVCRLFASVGMIDEAIHGWSDSAVVKNNYPRLSRMGLVTIVEVAAAGLMKTKFKVLLPGKWPKSLAITSGKITRDWSDYWLVRTQTRAGTGNILGHFFLPKAFLRGFASRAGYLKNRQSRCGVSL